MNQLIAKQCDWRLFKQALCCAAICVCLTSSSIAQDLQEKPKQQSVTPAQFAYDPGSGVLTIKGPKETVQQVFDAIQDFQAEQTQTGQQASERAGITFEPELGILTVRGSKETVEQVVSAIQVRKTEDTDTATLVAQLAQTLSDLKTAGSDSEKTVAVSKLRDLIALQFDADLAGRKKQLDALQKQFESAQQMLARREAKRNDIIESRLQKLLDAPVAETGDLEVRQPSVMTSPEQASSAAKQPRIVNSEQSAANPMLGNSKSDLQLSVGSFGARVESLLGSANQLGRRIRETRQQVLDTEGQVNKLDTQMKEYQRRIASHEAELKEAEDNEAARKNLRSLRDWVQVRSNELAQVKNELKYQQDVLAEAEREKQIIISLLESELELSKQRLNQVNAQYENQKKLYANGYISVTELRLEEQRIAAAETQIKQIHLLLDFYKQLGGSSE